MPGMGQIVNNIQGPAAPAGGQIVAAVKSPLGDMVPPYTGTNGLRGGSEYRIHTEIPWAQADDYPRSVLGDVQSGSTSSSISRSPLPQKHPTKSNLVCMECNLVEARGAYRASATTGLIEFFDNKPSTGAVLQTQGAAASPATPDGFAVFELVFRYPGFDIGTGLFAPGGVEYNRFTIKESRDAVESMTLPGNAFKWKSDGTELPEGPVILRSLRELTYTWVLVPDDVVTNLEDNLWDAVEGRINDDVFDGYADGTLLCLAPQKSPPYTSPGGTICRDVSYHFVYRADAPSWNHYYRRSTRKFEEVVTTDGTSTPYVFVSFKPLFLGPATPPPAAP